MQYIIAKYRSGTRYVVILADTTTAGAEVVFGPAALAACEDYIARNPLK